MKANKRDSPKLREYQKIIDQHFSDEAWTSHKVTDAIPPELSEKMQRRISDQISLREEASERKMEFKSRVLYIAKYLSAACLITISGLGLWHSTKQSPKTPAQQTVAQRTMAAPAMEEIYNSSSIVQRILLPDSSAVNLSPNSTLKYDRDFQQKFRDVYLIGKAYFKVKRNVDRPFSVHAGGLKTTALGTSFTIDTKVSKSHTSVLLHTGKIVIKPTETDAEPIYIAKAGAGILFDTQNQIAAMIKAPKIKKPATERSLHREGTALVMKNIPLEKVLTLLNEAYHVNITVAQKDIANISYTGTVDTAKEQLEQVLTVICLINNLQLSRGAAQEFIIEKSNKQNQ